MIDTSIVGNFTRETDIKSKALTITFRADEIDNWSLSEGNDFFHY